MVEYRTCPHCGGHMDAIETPADSSWGGEIHTVCFNDECCYFQRSWNTLESQGIENVGYRCRFDARGAIRALAVRTLYDLKECIIREEQAEPGTLDMFPAEDFALDDDTPDAEFYKTPRFVDHLDSLALSTVEDLFVKLIPQGSRILDLMAGPDSHLRPEIEPASVTGLGLNEEELQRNATLTRRVVHDVNANPVMPIGDNEFDVVINTVSVDYLVKPVEVFREVARVLRPGGLFIVVFSNRMFPPKAVKIWKVTNEAERGDLVRKFLFGADRFYFEGRSESKGQPRPVDDEYYSLGIPSDPIYAIWARTVK